MVFGEVNTGYLAVPICDKMHPVHAIVLDLEDLLFLQAPVIRGHKTLTSHMPYLLLVHDGEFFTDYLLPFCTRICIGMVRGLGEGLGFIRFRLGVVSYHI